jgi:hypothetical protein
MKATSLSAWAFMIGVRFDRIPKLRVANAAPGCVSTRGQSTRSIQRELGDVPTRHVQDNHATVRVSGFAQMQISVSPPLLLCRGGGTYKFFLRRRHLIGEGNDQMKASFAVLHRLSRRSE